MQQPVPSVTRKDVERVARRDYSNAKETVAILDEYGRESWQRERHRVQLAIMKLAAGDLTALRAHLETAKRDYRDVLAFAEYPRYHCEVFPGSELADPRVKEVIVADWKQYREWLDQTRAFDARAFWFAFGIAVTLGALVWVYSRPITGEIEPWDADGFYYPAALFLAGMAPALLSTSRFWLLPLGVILGELIVFLFRVYQGPGGPLWPLGVIFLVLYSLPAFLGAGLGVVVRQLFLKSFTRRTTDQP